MTSLPPKVAQSLQDVAHVLNAYDTCLRLEECLQLAAEKDDDVANNLIFIRILGYLIHYAPTARGLKTVVEEISSCADDSALLVVGKMYYDHYIRACTFLVRFRFRICSSNRSDALTSSRQ